MAQTVLFCPKGPCEVIKVRAADTCQLNYQVDSSWIIWWSSDSKRYFGCKTQKRSLGTQIVPQNSWTSEFISTTSESLKMCFDWNSQVFRLLQEQYLDFLLAVKEILYIQPSRPIDETIQCVSDWLLAKICGIFFPGGRFGSKKEKKSWLPLCFFIFYL